MTKLTSIEQQALKGILDSDYMDGDKGELAIDRPVWTWSANPFGSKPTFSGAVSSLRKKGLVRVCQDGKDSTISITAAGMAVYEAAVAAQREMQAEIDAYVARIVATATDEAVYDENGERM